MIGEIRLLNGNSFKVDKQDVKVRNNKITIRSHGYTNLIDEIEYY